MKKATLITIAGTMEGKSLYAIHDTDGRTEFQLWETPERISKLYKLN